MKEATGYHSGIDCFFSDVEKPPREDLSCQACEAKLTGERVNGPTSWAGAMSGSKRDHWRYLCHNAGEKGHNRLVLLFKEAAGFESERLREIVMDELADSRRAFLASIRVEGEGGS